jgi:hypothetical protein
MGVTFGLVPVIAVAVAVCLAGPAEAACQPSDNIGISFSSTDVGSYNPFKPTLSKTVTVTVTAATSCTVQLAFFRPVLPAQMTGPGVLNYDVLNGGGASLLFSVVGDPLATQPIVVGPGNPGTATVQISVPAGQVVADGLSYSDTSLVAQVFDKTDTTFTLLNAEAMRVDGEVAKVCEFTAPTSSALNFTSAIANGRPNPAHVQSVSFNGVSCTAPTRVQLSGNAMRHTSAGAASGFDNFVNYRATATFNSASSVLDTSQGSTASSASQNTSTGATVNGSISVDVNLLAGNPLLAGSYTATLTLSVDPSW